MRFRGWLIRGVLIAICALMVLDVPPAAAAPAGPTSTQHVPVYAYFYQWYDHGSWRRAKADYPLVGTYSSDDPHILRDQIEEAKAAGIDGFLTSWKSTPQLNRRLDLLLRIASGLDFQVGVVYEALDFAREPLPAAKVRSDLSFLMQRWGPALKSTDFGKPLIAWTGTDQYSLSDIASVRAMLAGRAFLLATSKDAEQYQRVAAEVDGEAYYWSSANPRASSTLPRLKDLATAVHAHNGIWVAPAAPGFDGRTLGHLRVVDRAGGATLTQSLTNAFASSPDAVGRDQLERVVGEHLHRTGPALRPARVQCAAEVPGCPWQRCRVQPPGAPGNRATWTVVRPAGGWSAYPAVPGRSGRSDPAGRTTRPAGSARSADESSSQPERQPDQDAGGITACRDSASLDGSERLPFWSLS